MPAEGRRPDRGLARAYPPAGRAQRLSEREALLGAQVYRAWHRSADRAPAWAPLEERPRYQRERYYLHAEYADRGNLHLAGSRAHERNRALHQAAELRRHAARRLQPHVRRRPGGAIERWHWRGGAARSARHR